MSKIYMPSLYSILLVFNARDFKLALAGLGRVEIGTSASLPFHRQPKLNEFSSGEGERTPVYVHTLQTENIPYLTLVDQTQIYNK